MKAGRILAIAASMALAFSMTAVPVNAASEITKEETVYIVTDSTGSEDEIVVSDHLINAIGSDTIDDRTNLTDLENVKGDETFNKGKGSQIVWNADGNDIFYEGNSSSRPPVTMDITYKLDGKEVKGSDLEGKSGDVEIDIDFNSNAKASIGKAEVTVPFLAIVGFIASDDSFSDIEIDHGKIIDDGDKEMVIGMAVPGLSDALDIDLDDHDIDLNDSVTIRGKAKDYDIRDIMTVVTNSVFEDIDTEDMDLDFDDDINELDKAGKQLVDGTDALYKGISTLNDNMPDLEEGVGKLKKGAKDLSNGTEAAKQGAVKLDQGVRELKNELSSQMSDMVSGTAKLKKGSKEVLDGMNELKKELEKGEGTAKNPGAIPALEQVEGGLGQAESGLGTAADSIDQVNNSLTAVKTGAAGVSDYLEDLAGELKKLSPEQEAKVRQTIGDSLVDRLSNVTTEAETVSGTLSAVSGDSGTLSQISGGVSTAKAGVTGSKNGVKAVREGLETASSSLGAYDPNEGISQTTLIGGQTVIYYGLKEINDKLTESTGKNGKLTLGLNSLVSGTGSLKKGEISLAGGAKQLADGMNSLDSNTGKLSSGVSRLDKGSLELSRGMSKFYSEGIKKLVDMYKNDLKGSVDGLKNAVDAGNEYRIFTELPNDMNGNVKFIYKTSVY